MRRQGPGQRRRLVGGLGRAATHQGQKQPCQLCTALCRQLWVQPGPRSQCSPRWATHVLLTICSRSPFLKDRSVSVRDS